MNLYPLDARRYSLLVEGMSDVYAYRYFIKKYLPEYDCINIVSTNGADAMSPILNILVGWKVDVPILLDGDEKVVQYSRKYKKQCLLDKDKIQNLRDIYDSKKDIILENLFQDDINQKVISFSPK
ncbi:TOPRIM nucleotidyl transferase/hydrolase domain-containing protein [Candidatus Liberibacter brunswickensis]|uniref:TOPRIM nucleotidyl transferase/hydrolase domain-containing protein n=1 Tax=Candidatus Liberibacter brunswickensis TaxID=1968796 RepID=UPI002FE0C1F7